MKSLLKYLGIGALAGAGGYLVYQGMRVPPLSPTEREALSEGLKAALEVVHDKGVEVQDGFFMTTIGGRIRAAAVSGTGSINCN